MSKDSSVSITGTNVISALLDMHCQTLAILNTLLEVQCEILAKLNDADSDELYKRYRLACVEALRDMKMQLAATYGDIPSPKGSQPWGQS